MFSPPQPGAPGAPVKVSAAAPQPLSASHAAPLPQLTATPFQPPPREDSAGGSTQIFGRSTAPKSSHPSVAPPPTGQRPTADAPVVVLPVAPATAAPSVNQRYLDDELSDEESSGSDESAEESSDAEFAPASSRSPVTAPIELPAERTAPAPQLLAPTEPPLVMEDAAPSSFPLMAVLVALVVALAAGVGYLAYKRFATPTGPSGAVLAQHQVAEAMLRRDDRKSMEVAIEQLTALSAEQPRYTEAHADLVMAISYASDDLRAQASQLSGEFEALKRSIEDLRVAQSPEDWENRVAALVSEQDDLTAKLHPIEQQLAKLTESLTLARGRLNPAEERPEGALAVLQAQTLFAAITGNIEALTLIERLRALDPTGPEASVTYAEYVLNSRGPPDSIARARAELDALRNADASFLRLYVLQARLAAQERRFDDAAGSLRSVLALNPDHELAKFLQPRYEKAAEAQR